MCKPIASVLLLAALIAGCGGKSNSVPPPPSTAQIQGKWSGVATSSTGATATADADLQQAGSSVFSTAGNNTQINGRCATPSDSMSGQITGNSVAIIVTEGGQHVNLNGTVSADGQSMSGTYTSDAGGCTQGDTGTWTASKIASVSGTYSGTVNSDVRPQPIPVGVSGSLAEDAQWNLTAALQVTNSVCFSSLNLFGGTAGRLVILLDSASTIQIGGSAVDNAAHTINVFYQITSGPCAGDHGHGTLTRSGP